MSLSLLEASRVKRRKRFHMDDKENQLPHNRIPLDRQRASAAVVLLVDEFPNILVVL